MTDNDNFQRDHRDLAERSSQSRLNRENFFKPVDITCSGRKPLWRDIMFYILNIGEVTMLSAPKYALNRRMIVDARIIAIICTIST